MDRERPPDRRVRRTKQRLAEALQELIIERGYDRTTVQDIIDRADVGRSTFYAHYETKDDLLIGGLDGFAAEMELQLAGSRVHERSIMPSLAFFRHVAEDHDLHRALIGSRGIEIATESVHRMLLRHARAGLELRTGAGDRTAIPLEVRAEFLAGSLLAFLTWWLDNDMPYPPERMDEMYQELTGSAQTWAGQRS